MADIVDLDRWQALRVAYANATDASPSFRLLQEAHGRASRARARPRRTTKRAARSASAASGIPTCSRPSSAASPSSPSASKWPLPRSSGSTPCSGSPAPGAMGCDSWSGRNMPGKIRDEGLEAGELGKLDIFARGRGGARRCDDASRRIKLLLHQALAKDVVAFRYEAPLKLLEHGEMRRTIRNGPARPGRILDHHQPANKGARLLAECAFPIGGP